MTDPFSSRHVEKKRLSFLPTLPESFIPRPEPLNRLRGLVMQPGTHTVVITSKDGLGGMGKTSLALALTQDETIQASFPDGILWATLGETPETINILGQWLGTLDAQGLQTPTIALASEQLRHWVKQKSLLLIIDELWELEDLKPFQVVEGTASRLVITTRDVEVPDSELLTLGEMSGNQSLQLFETQLKQSLEQRNKKDALQFAKAVGHLPLSLALGGAQIKNGQVWSELLSNLKESPANDIDEEESRPGLANPLNNLQNLLKLGKTKEIQHQARQACLKFCLNQLSPELSLRLATLSLFPRNLEISPKMAGTVWRLSIAEARQILQELKLRGFLTQGQVDPEQGQSYSLHPVIRDMAQWILSLPTRGELQGLGLSWQSAHQQFLERYRPMLDRGQWHTIPNDGYIHPHFLWHLEQAGWRGEIHQLLQAFSENGRNAWYEVCDRLGLKSVFSVDIGRAWQLAKDVYPEAPEHSMGLQVRYALTSSFLREVQPSPKVDVTSESADPSPEDTKPKFRNITNGDRLEEDWAFTNVLLKAARYLPDLATKVIKSTYYPSTLDEDSKEETIYELLKNVHQESPEMALELTEHILPSPSAIAALSKLLPNHATFSLPLLQLISNASQGQSITEGLQALVKQPDHKLHPELFNLLGKLNNPLDQIILLDQFEHRLPDILKAKAKAFRAESLNQLHQSRKGLGYLPMEDSEVLKNIDRATEEFIELNQFKGDAIALCFEDYPSQRLEDAYQQAIESRSEEKRSKTLAFLIPKLSEKHRREIWHLRHQFIDPECKARLLVSLLPYRTEALKPLLELLKLFENNKKLDFLMGSLPAPAAIVQEIFKTLLAVSNPSDRWPHLVKLLPYINRDLEPGFVEVLEETPYDTQGMRQLIQDIQPQQAILIQGVLDALENIPPVFERAKAIREVTPFLSNEMKMQTLQVAQNIQFPYAKVIALQNFIPMFPELGKDALKALRNCHQESPDDVYESLIPTLPATERREAIALMDTISDESSRVKRLVRTLPYQPDLLGKITSLTDQTSLELDEVLEELHEICFTELSESHPKEPQILSLIQAVLPLIDHLYQPGLLGSSANSSREFSPLLQQYLKQCGEESLTLDHVDLLLDFFYLIPTEPKRSQTLAEIITRATQQQQVSPELWMAWLEKIARFQPHEFHWLLSSLLNSLMAFSETHTLNQILQSIRAVREQWK